MANKAKTFSSPKTKQALAHWYNVTTESLDILPVDLSARQSAVLLHVYLHEELCGIKDLATQLGISKPAICRAVDVLEAENLLRRKPDRNDKRHILLHPTAKGNKYLHKFADIVIKAPKKV